MNFIIKAKKRKPSRSTLKGSGPLSEGARGAVGVLMFLMLVAPLLLYAFLYPPHRARELTINLVPDPAIVVPTAGFWLAYLASFSALFALDTLVVGLVFGLLPLNIRRQLGDTPISARALTVGYGSAFAVFGILIVAGLQSYVGLTQQGIVRNGFFEYRDHLTPYQDIKAVVIDCRSYVSKGRTVLRMTMSARTLDGEEIDILESADGEDLHLRGETGGPDRTASLTPESIQWMHHTLTDRHIAVHSTPCAAGYGAHMSAWQRTYITALFPNMFR